MSAPGKALAHLARVLVFAPDNSPLGPAKCAEIADSGQAIPHLRNLHEYRAGEVEPMASKVIVLCNKVTVEKAKLVHADYADRVEVEVYEEEEGDGEEMSQEGQPAAPEGKRRKVKEQE